jgi:hypothetical protein
MMICMMKKILNNFFEVKEFIKNEGDEVKYVGEV